MAMLLSAVSAVLGAPACPSGSTKLDTFTAEGKLWIACEDLSHPSGAIALVSDETLYFPKTYEPYTQGDDESYYLGLGKQTVLNAKWDMLGDAIVNNCTEKTPTTKLCEPTWKRVERAVPIMRYSRGNKQASGNNFMCSPYSVESGVRTFTGSRSASVDATFSDHADDCTDNGFPRPQGYVMNLTAIADGEPPIHDFLKYVNFSGMADGLVGGGSGYPNLIFYFPIIKQNFSTFGGSRYWTMIASPVADMQGGREQSVWFRFQQYQCPGLSMEQGSCKLLGRPQYYDTYWYSYSPITTRWIPPELMANSSGFYNNLLKVKRYWDAELATEGMMRLDLPDTPTTNGTWLVHQGVFAIVRSMISRDDTWHPRYGVIPGYGISLQDGFQDTFTSTATAALEMGAFVYARGVIDNHLKYYVRDNGMITYRAEELAQSGRMLTIFALYQSFTADSTLMLQHFGKVRALARWLLYRFHTALSNFPDPADPRHGIVEGGDEGDGFVGFYETYGKMPLEHKYSCHANVYRGFLDAGTMWVYLGKAWKKPEMTQHGQELLDAAPLLLSAFEASLNKTTVTTHNPRAPRCVPTGADPAKGGGLPVGCLGDFRGIPELMYAGVLTHQQADDLFTYFTYSNDSALVTRPLTLGCSGYNNKCSTYTTYGMGYGLLVADMVERFLLHYFGVALHTYTRGSWTTPEAAHPDRDVGSTDYVAAGVHTAPTYLKWMLVFEEPNTKCVWLAKALPREWLESATSTPVVVTDAPTRYGRVSYRLKASGTTTTTYAVAANVTLPAGYFQRAPIGVQPGGPPGGVRLRLRAPQALAGKLKSVTVGGKAWTKFDPVAETIDFPLDALVATPTLMGGLQNIVAKWGA